MSDNTANTHEPTSFEMVGEFHDTFNHPRFNTPQLNIFKENPKEVALRIALIREELLELEEACRNEDMVEVVDALCDIKYVTDGAGHSFGIDLDAAFKEVHSSNMTKKCDTEEDAIESVRRYREEGRYKDPTYKRSKCGRYYIVVDESTGKILKNYKYRPADLKRFAVPVSDESTD